MQNYLGSINHTLLSIEVLKSRNINLLGIVFNGAPHKLSEDIILKSAKVPMLGRIGKEVNITKNILAKYVEQFRNI